MGIVKPIKASWLSVWVTFCSRKQPTAEALLLNITLRTCLLLVTLQYPLLELCVLRIWALGCGASLTAPAGTEPLPGHSVAMQCGQIFHSCPLSLHVFSWLTLLQWPRQCLLSILWITGVVVFGCSAQWNILSVVPLISTRAMPAFAGITCNLKLYAREKTLSIYFIGFLRHNQKCKAPLGTLVLSLKEAGKRLGHILTVAVVPWFNILEDSGIRWYLGFPLP